MKSSLTQRQVVILISGRGSNMRSLIDQSREPGAPYTVCRVFSDKPDAAGLDLARSLGVPAQALPAAATADRAAYDRALAAAIQIYSPSLIVLAGFMRILSAQFVKDFAGKLLNIHPSLLPAFPGLHAQRKALQYGVSVAGCTVHFVDESVDGGVIILQRTAEVLPEDTEETLSERILEQEHLAYVEALQRVLSGEYEARGRRYLPIAVETTAS